MDKDTKPLKNKKKIAKNAFGMVPSLLVAPPYLRNSPFEEAVILLAGHRPDGSMGFIINHPIGLYIKDLLDDNEKQNISFTHKPIFFGGPSSKNSGFVLYEHEKNNPLAPGFFVTKNISVSPARKMLEHAATGSLPGRFEVILGYASWRRGQLFQEISRGGWLHIPFKPQIFFDVSPEDRWQYCYDTLLGVDPFAFMDVRGGAQA